MDLENLKFLVVGAGFFGSVMAERIANDLGERVLVIDNRNHVGGNCYSAIDPQTGIEYHKYGTHIFHTSNPEVWNYIQRFTDFNNYYHQVLTTYRNRVYQMPINLETINSFYDLNLKPEEARNFIQKEVEKENIKNPGNFEEKAISQIGRPLYEAFFKGYTKKQWQKDPQELPANTFDRLPFRTNYDESYYFSRWQGIPLDGYAAIFDMLLSNSRIDIELDIDFFDIKDKINADTFVIYSGPIDRFFDYKYGRLEWRTLRFESEIKDVEDFQGTSVMNYAEESIPYTRIHEPRHLHPERDYTSSRTLIIREFSQNDTGQNPFFPINDRTSQELMIKYRREASRQQNLIISGRLGEYKYLDMHQTIAAALDAYQKIKLGFASKVS